MPMMYVVGNPIVDSPTLLNSMSNIVKNSFPTDILVPALFNKRHAYRVATHWEGLINAVFTVFIPKKFFTTNLNNQEKYIWAAQGVDYPIKGLAIPRDNLQLVSAEVLEQYYSFQTNKLSKTYQQLWDAHYQKPGDERDAVVTMLDYYRRPRWIGPKHFKQSDKLLIFKNDSENLLKIFQEEWNLLSTKEQNKNSSEFSAMLQVGIANLESQIPQPPSKSTSSIIQKIVSQPPIIKRTIKPLKAKQEVQLYAEKITHRFPQPLRRPMANSSVMIGNTIIRRP